MSRIFLRWIAGPRPVPALPLDATPLARAFTGATQLATFHPAHQFGDAPDDAASHWTNRSPFPVLHLWREADVERALESKDGHDVWRRNVAAVEALGAADMERRVRDCLT